MSDGPWPSQQLRDAAKQPPDYRDVRAWRAAKVAACTILATGFFFNIAGMSDPTGILTNIGTALVFGTIPVFLGVYFVVRVIRGAGK